MLSPVFRLLHAIHHWNMVDVFMLGILVSLVKLAGMAEKVFGIGFYAYMVLIFIMAAMTGNTRVLDYPWQREITPDIQVDINIRMSDAEPGSAVYLEAA